MGNLHERTCEVSDAQKRCGTERSERTSLSNEVKNQNDVIGIILTESINRCRCDFQYHHSPFCF